MRSVSGLRGIVGKDLTEDVVRRYAGAFGTFPPRARGGRVVALGRDSRQSGPAFRRRRCPGARRRRLWDVSDLGMVPTPTAQDGGGNRRTGGRHHRDRQPQSVEWNALKFMGPGGRFLTKDEAGEFFALVDGGKPLPAAPKPGAVTHDAGAVARHLAKLYAPAWLELGKIKTRRFTVALDCVRGAGATIIASAARGPGLYVPLHQPRARRSLPARARADSRAPWRAGRAGPTDPRRHRDRRGPRRGPLRPGGRDRASDRGGLHSRHRGSRRAVAQRGPGGDQPLDQPGGGRRGPGVRPDGRAGAGR